MNVQQLILFLRRSSALTGSILLCLLGCKTPKGLPDDPLFVSRTPIEVKAHAGPPVQLVATEPAVPVDPVARQPGPPSSDSQPARQPPGQPEGSPDPVQIVPPQR